MLTVETIGRIRREHFLKGKTIKEIARGLKVSRNTVHKALQDPQRKYFPLKTYALRPHCALPHRFGEVVLQH